MSGNAELLSVSNTDTRFISLIISKMGVDSNLQIHKLLMPGLRVVTAAPQFCFLACSVRWQPSDNVENVCVYKTLPPVCSFYLALSSVWEQNY